MAADRNGETFPADILNNPGIVQSILRQAVDGIVISDAAGRLVLVNMAAERMARSAPEGLSVGTAPRSWGEAFENGRKIPIEEWSTPRALRGEVIEGREVRMVHADGTAYDIRISSAPVIDDTGKIVATVAIFSDITTKKRLEEELRRKEAHLQMMMDFVPIGIFECDAQGRSVYTNRKWIEISGKTADENLEYGWLDAVHPGDRDAVFNSWHQFVARGDAWVHEYRILNPDGKVSWVRAVAAPLKDADGRVTSFVGTVEDITERKEAERVRKESEERIRFVLEATDAGWWDWDCRGPNAFWSEGLWDLYGLDPAHDRSSYDTWLRIIHPDDREATDRSFRETLEQRRSYWKTEFRVMHAQRGILWLMGIGRATYDTDGTPQRFAGLNLDITERKQAEEALNAAKEEAERANQAKSRFLAAASHDLRQPLNAMTLLLATLRQAARGERDTMILDRLEASLGAMLELFNTLFDLAQLQSGAVKVHRTAVVVQDVLRHLAADYSGAAAGKGIDLRFVPCRAVLQTDGVLLGRILRNLVGNAIRHIPSGRVLVGCRHRDGGIRIDVIDTGPGIPQDQIDAIFDEFHQLNNTTRSRDTGYGLGLSIVRDTARLLGHRLEVVSVPGRGSRFSVEVPRVMTETVPIAQRAPTPADRKSCVVLLIEDDPLVRTATQWCLEDLGCAVHASATGAEARSMITSLAPTLIIADYRLPDEQNGLAVVFDLCDRLGTNPVACVISGDIRDDVRNRAERAGICWLSKPVRLEELVALVAEAHRRCADGDP